MSEPCPQCRFPLTREMARCPQCRRPAASWREPEIIVHSGMKIRDRYVVRRVLGQGAGGPSLLVSDETSGCELVMEALDIPPGRGPERRARLSFRRAQMLDHPHIVPVHALESWEEQADGLWLLRSFVHGRSLATLLARSGHSLEEILPILRQVASALDYAHSLPVPVCHGFLSLRQLRLSDEDARVRLCGFGPAVLSARSLAIPYQSPELLRGEKVTPLADIHAFAAIIYELLSQQPPFRHVGVEDRLLDSAPHSLTGFPGQINWPLMAALSPDPALRPQTAGELVAALAGERPATVYRLEEERTSRRKRWLWHVRRLRLAMAVRISPWNPHRARQGLPPSTDPERETKRGLPGNPVAEISLPSLDQPHVHPQTAGLEGQEGVVIVQNGELNAMGHFMGHLLNFIRERPAFVAGVGVGVVLLLVGAWGFRGEISWQERFAALSPPPPAPKAAVPEVAVVEPVRKEPPTVSSDQGEASPPEEDKGEVAAAPVDSPADPVETPVAQAAGIPEETPDRSLILPPMHILTATQKPSSEADTSPEAVEDKPATSSDGAVVAPVPPPAQVLPAPAASAPRAAAPPEAKPMAKSAPGRFPFAAMGKGPYFVRAGAFSDSKNATRAQELLLRRKIPSQQSTTSTDGQSLTRVLVGPFSGWEETKLAMTLIHQWTGLPTGWIRNPDWKGAFPAVDE